MNRIDKILSNKVYINLMTTIEKNEKDRRFCRHGISHSMDVARIALILNLEEKLDIKKDVIYAAALLHDIGRADADISGDNHQILSLEYAESILKASVFSEDEIKEITDAISMHNTKDADAKGLTGLLYRADKFSRFCFICGASDECYWSDEDKNKGVIY